MGSPQNARRISNIVANVFEKVLVEIQIISDENNTAVAQALSAWLCLIYTFAARKCKWKS